MIHVKARRKVPVISTLGRLFRSSERMQNRVVVALFSLVLSWVAAAKPVVVDVQDGLVFGSNRIRAMGGAFTGVAEGSAGHLFNPATLVNRSMNYTPSPRSLGLDVGYAQSMVRYTFPKLVPDKPELPPPDLPAYTGFISTQYQVNEHGVGGTLQTQGYAFEAAPGEEVLVNHHQLAAGYAIGLFEQRVLIGALAKLHMGTVTRDGLAQAAPSQRALFPGAQIGVIVKPTDRLRVGWTLAPAARAELEQQEEDEPLSITMHQPLVSILGFSYQWEAEVEVDGKYRDRRTLLVASDLVYLGGNEEALSAAHLTRGIHFSSGGVPSLALHLGLESEVVPGWLRLRAGLYTEPARYVIETPKLHLTSGIHLRVFSLPRKLRWGLVGMVDLAADYSDSSVGIGFW
jgi:hypothetical protein